MNLLSASPGLPIKAKTKPVMMARMKAMPQQKNNPARCRPSCRVLVFGAGGRLGRLLRLAWQRNPPHRLAPLYHARSGPSDFHWDHQSDSRLPAADVILALWGKTSGSADDLMANTTLAHASQKTARQSGARRVLHFSSAAVYGPAQDASETTPARPANAYGHSKLAMEQAIAGFPAEFPDEDIHHCCLRLANVVGADSLAPALRSDTPVTLDRFSDGRGPLRSYVGLGHLARILEALCKIPVHSLPTILNISSPNPVEMQALAEAADKKILWQEAPETALQKVTLDSSRLAHLLPEVDALTTASQMITDWQRLEALT
jgi:UDP-glucose 4-epimerase